MLSSSFSVAAGASTTNNSSSHHRNDYSSAVFNNPSLQHMSSASSSLAGVICMIAKCRFQFNDIYGTDVSAVNVPLLYQHIAAPPAHPNEPLIEVSANPTVLLMMPKLLESRMYAALLNRAGIQTFVSNNPLDAYRTYLAPTRSQRQKISLKKGEQSTTISDAHQHARGDDAAGWRGGRRRDDVKISMVIADWGMADEVSGTTPQDILQFMKRDADLIGPPSGATSSPLLPPSTPGSPPPTAGGVSSSSNNTTVCVVALCGKGVLIGNALRSGAHLFLRKPLMLHLQVVQKLLMPRAMAMPGFPAELLRQRGNHEALKAVLSEALIGVGADEMMVRKGDNNSSSDDDDDMTTSTNGGENFSSDSFSLLSKQQQQQHGGGGTTGGNRSPNTNNLLDTSAANAASVARFTKKTADRLEMQEASNEKPSTFVSNMITYLKSHDPKHADARWHSVLASSVKALNSAKQELQRMSKEAAKSRAQCEVCWQQHRDVATYKPEEYFLGGGGGLGAHLTRRELTLRCIQLSVRCTELEQDKKQTDNALLAINSDSASLRQAMDDLLQNRRQQLRQQEEAAAAALLALQQQQKKKDESSHYSIHLNSLSESPAVSHTSFHKSTSNVSTGGGAGGGVGGAVPVGQGFKLEEVGPLSSPPLPSHTPAGASPAATSAVATSVAVDGGDGSSSGKATVSPLSPALLSMTTTNVAGAAAATTHNKTPNQKSSHRSSTSPTTATLTNATEKKNTAAHNKTPNQKSSHHSSTSPTTATLTNATATRRHSSGISPPPASISASSLRQLIRKRSNNAEVVAAAAAAALVAKKRYDAYERRMSLLECALMASEDWTIRYLPPHGVKKLVVLPPTQPPPPSTDPSPKSTTSRRKSVNPTAAAAAAKKQAQAALQQQEEEALLNAAPTFDCLSMWPPMIRPTIPAGGGGPSSAAAASAHLYRNVRSLLDHILQECAMTSKSLMFADPTLRDPLMALESHVSYHLDKFDAVQQFEHHATSLLHCSGGGGGDGSSHHGSVAGGSVPASPRSNHGGAVASSPVSALGDGASVPAASGGKKGKGGGKQVATIVPAAGANSENASHNNNNSKRSIGVPDGSPLSAANSSGAAVWKVAASSMSHLLTASASFVSTAAHSNNGSINPLIPPPSWRRQAPPEVKIYLHQMMQLQVNHLAGSSTRTMMRRRFLLWLGLACGGKRNRNSRDDDGDEKVLRAASSGLGGDRLKVDIDHSAAAPAALDPVVIPTPSSAASPTPSTTTPVPPSTMPTKEKLSSSNNNDSSSATPQTPLTPTPPSPAAAAAPGGAARKPPSKASTPQHAQQGGGEDRCGHHHSVAATTAAGRHSQRNEGLRNSLGGVWTRLLPVHVCSKQQQTTSCI
ncbi:Hypothetical protein, putative [Bodo saltans]|uniref:Uncharacterized protein n=1 Tax=Bodo saltans TaxID=75058 RepID=A0A0S4IX11_BODSA|nr:Hypothetical protein, putative [Bodo saltans]|eukprot:CUG06556.1 Hypothetical protein, putative [Bodo saltans]